MKRNASATWSGGLKDGQGRFSVSSGVLKDIKFSFRTRFENEPGTNPEELIAAAHASCFSMAGNSARVAGIPVCAGSGSTICGTVFPGNCRAVRSNAPPSSGP